MLAPLLIMLREGIEAALVIGIIISCLVRAGQQQWLPAVWSGVFLGIAVSFSMGGLLQMLGADFPQKQQELFEAVIGFIAVALLVGMVIWMSRAAQHVKADLQRAVDKALHAPATTQISLMTIAFLAVVREGLESVFFLLAIFQQSPGMAAPLGAILGIALSVVVGIAIVQSGKKLNLHQFFYWTGLFIIVVAAGLLAGSFRHLHEAGLWNILLTPVFDLSQTLPVSSIFGTILSGLFGYQENLSQGELLIYISFLAIMLPLFWRLTRRRPDLAASKNPSSQASS